VKCTPTTNDHNLYLLLSSSAYFECLFSQTVCIYGISGTTLYQFLKLFSQINYSKIETIVKHFFYILPNRIEEKIIQIKCQDNGDKDEIRSENTHNTS
jgi:hypothetical protein